MSDRYPQITSHTLSPDQHPNASFAALFIAVYADLEQCARSLLRKERTNHTLATMGLVHEAYERLIRTYHQGNQPEQLSTSDMLALTSTVMRHVLVDHARRRDARQNKVRWDRLGVDAAVIELRGMTIDLVALDEALAELAALDKRKAAVVEYRFFGGMSMKQIAQRIDCPLRTVERDWAFSRAWLFDRLSSDREAVDGKQ